MLKVEMKGFEYFQNRILGGNFFRAKYIKLADLLKYVQTLVYNPEITVLWSF